MTFRDFDCRNFVPDPDKVYDKQNVTQENIDSVINVTDLIMFMNGS